MDAFKLVATCDITKCSAILAIGTELLYLVKTLFVSK